VRIPYDQSCDTIERAYFGLTFNAAWGTPPVPLIHGGVVLAHDDSRLVFVESSAQLPSTSRSKPVHHAPRAASRPLTDAERSVERKWRGFRASDAAAHFYPEHITDKRQEKKLVAIDCPFIEEHATSNRAGTRQQRSDIDSRYDLAEYVMWRSPHSPDTRCGASSWQSISIGLELCPGSACNVAPQQCERRHL